MLGLILLYFVGKAYYDLAASHGKSKWGFAILGVLSYYGGLFLGGIVIALIYEFGFSKSIDESNDLVLGLMAIPIGVLVCWGFYKTLQQQWRKPKKPLLPDEILDAEFHQKDSN